MGVVVNKYRRKQVYLVFSKSLIQRPLIHEMSKKYSIIVNIGKADIDKRKGWVILTATGMDSQMDKAFQWMADQGVIVQTMFSLD